MRKLRLDLLSLLVIVGILFFSTAAQSQEEPMMSMMQPEVGREYIVLHTIAGPIILGLYSNIAPKHVEQILKLTRLGAYDGTHFYRLEPNFVLQLATVHDRPIPLTPEQLEAVKKIPGEFSSIPHAYGILSMARYPDDPNSAESSFSILLGPAPHLDGEYTVFGQVVGGLEVVQTLARAPRDTKNAPKVRLEVIRAEVVTDPVRLDELSKVKPTPVPLPGEEPSAQQQGLSERILTLVASLLFVMAVLLVIFLFDAQVSRRTRLSAILIAIFVAYFGIVATLVTEGHRDEWLAFALFVGVLATIRLMGQFDAAK